MNRVYHPETMALPVEVVSAGLFFQLPDYSHTLPLDTRPAAIRADFRWRRWVGRDACPSGWVTGEYGPAEVLAEGPCNAIVWRRVVFDELPPETGIVQHTAHMLVEGWCAGMGEHDTILSATWAGLQSGLARAYLSRR